jgi:hypothetical protein
VGRVVRALKHAWNAFEDAPRDLSPQYVGGPSVPPRQNRYPMRFVNDKSIIGSIYNRLALDVASIEFIHCKVDDYGVATKLVKDSLHDRITLDPNIDQSAQAFKQDIALTMFEVGHVAIVPIDSDINPLISTAYQIRQLRAGRVVGWFPRHVTVEVYDDREKDDSGKPVNGGITKQVTLPKDMVAIIENPFYSVMNEPSGTLQRLLRKLSLLDGIDEAIGSGKLDLIFQLPYTVRSETRKVEAESRRKALRDQLKDDELGIGYIDVSEKVIQLNRQVDNKLLDQIINLTKQLYDQLGLTPEILNSTADQNAVNGYYDRTIEPIANAIALEMKRKFLTKTARAQNHSIEIYRDPLKLIPVDELAEVADKLIRNAILTANEFRPKIGFWPSSEPSANKLQNPNMPIQDQIGGEETRLQLMPGKEEPNDAGLRRIV